MSLSGAPSKAEVMGWGPVNLANYMGKVSIEAAAVPFSAKFL